MVVAAGDGDDGEGESRRLSRAEETGGAWLRGYGGATAEVTSSMCLLGRVGTRHIPR